jgi:hypothetical protein
MIMIMIMITYLPLLIYAREEYDCNSVFDALPYQGLNPHRGMRASIMLSSQRPLCRVRHPAENLSPQHLAAVTV